MQDNRTVILQCALKAFSRKGYEGVGIQEIVDAAHVTKPTLYHYFASKKGLFETLMREWSLPLLRDVKTAAAYKGDLVLNLRQLVETIFAYSQKEREFFRLLLSLVYVPNDSEVHDAVTDQHRALWSEIQTLFYAAEKDHGNMKGRSIQYAASFMGLINTYISLDLNGEVPLEGDWVHRVIHQFMHGIFS